MTKILLAALILVNLNTASLAQLDTLTGVGPVLAQRIIDGRPYYSIDGLLKVKGIGEKTLQNIKTQGLAYVVKQAPSPAPPTPQRSKAPAGQSLPKPQKTDKKVSVAPAAISQPANIKDSSNPWLLFIVTGAITIISAIIFLIFKWKFDFKL